MSEEHYNKAREMATQIKEKNTELAIYREKMKPISSAISRLMKEKDSLIRKRNAEIELAEVMVTDHAVLRYLERIEGLSLEEYKNKILPENLKKNLIYFKGGDYDVGTHKVRIQNGVVITVIPKFDTTTLKGWFQKKILEPIKTGFRLSDYLTDEEKQKINSLKN